MEKDKTAPEYEAPRIEDHGDLTELTAASHSGAYFDGTYTTGKGVATPPGGVLQTSP